MTSMYWIVKWIKPKFTHIGPLMLWIYLIVCIVEIKLGIFPFLFDINKKETNINCNIQYSYTALQTIPSYKVVYSTTKSTLKLHISSKKWEILTPLTSFYRPLNIRLVGVFCLKLWWPNFPFLHLHISQSTHDVIIFQLNKKKRKNGRKKKLPSFLLSWSPSNWKPGSNRKEAKTI